MPGAQARTILSGIALEDSRTGPGGRRLVEGRGDNFRLAAGIDEGRLQFEQAHYLAPVRVALERV